MESSLAALKNMIVVISRGLSKRDLGTTMASRSPSPSEILTNKVLINFEQLPGLAWVFLRTKENSYAAAVSVQPNNGAVGQPSVHGSLSSAYPGRCILNCVEKSCLPSMVLTLLHCWKSTTSSSSIQPSIQL